MITCGTLVNVFTTFTQPNPLQVFFFSVWHSWATYFFWYGLIGLLYSSLSSMYFLHELGPIRIFLRVYLCIRWLLSMTKLNIKTAHATKIALFCQVMKRDLWGCPVVSGTVKLMGDPLGPMDCGVGTDKVCFMPSHKCTIAHMGKIMLEGRDQPWTISI